MNIKKYVETKETKDYTFEVEYNPAHGCPGWRLLFYPDCGWICTIADFGTKKEAMKEMKEWAKASAEELKKLYYGKKEERDQVLIDTFGEEVTESIHLAEKL